MGAVAGDLVGLAVHWVTPACIVAHRDDDNNNYYYYYYLMLLS
jgi:hypothetical protein